MMISIFVNGLVSERSSDIINRIYAKNKAYRNFTPDIIRLLDSIKNALPLEDRNLLEELDDYQGQREIILYEALYRQGVIDGLRLGNLTRRVKVRVKHNKR
jgi:hypothetical protein